MTSVIIGFCNVQARLRNQGCAIKAVQSRLCNQGCADKGCARKVVPSRSCKQGCAIKATSQQASKPASQQTASQQASRQASNKQGWAPLSQRPLDIPKPMTRSTPANQRLLPHSYGTTCGRHIGLPYRCAMAYNLVRHALLLRCCAAVLLVGTGIRVI